MILFAILGILTACGLSAILCALTRLCVGARVPHRTAAIASVFVVLVFHAAPYMIHLLGNGLGPPRPSVVIGFIMFPLIAPLVFGVTFGVLGYYTALALHAIIGISFVPVYYRLLTRGNHTSANKIMIRPDSKSRG
jgi:hypothetical protein